MPYEGNPLRHTAHATKVVKHGAPVTEDKFVGSAFKVAQLGRFVDPMSAAATDIPIGEEFEIQLGSICEAPKAAGVAAAVVGDAIYITVATNALVLSAAALAAGVLQAGFLPFGRVDEIDVTRNPDVLRINTLVAGELPG